MARVSVAEGVAYGINHFGYLLGVTIFGLLFFIVGTGLLINGPPLVGILLLLVGIIASYAGAVGTLYKVIADGVTKGMEDTESTTTARKIPTQED